MKEDNSKINDLLSKIDFNAFFLLKKTEYKFTIPITAVLCFISLFLIEYLFPKSIFTQYPPDVYISTIQIIPVMLLTFCSGTTASSIVVVLFFSVKTLRGGMAYDTILQLISILFISIPISKGYFKSIYKTILTWIILTLCTGSGWQFLFAILKGDYDLLSILTLEPAQVSGIPCLITCATCYLCTRFLPERFKSIFYGHALNSTAIKQLRKMEKKNKNIVTSLDSLLFFLISTEAIVLMICTLGFSGALFTSVQTLEKDENIIFITRLFFLMLLVTIPFIMLIKDIASFHISNPLMLMARIIADTYDSMDINPSISIQDLDIKSKNEIGILYQALIQSEKNIKAYIEKIQQEKLLLQSLADEKAASKAKSAFLSNMSHEIRTPINAVLGLDEMILRECTDKEILNYAHDIQNAGKTLLSLINDILDFSKIEAGKMEIIPVEYDLSSTINDLVNMIAKRAENKGLELNINIDNNIPHLLYGDEIRIKQCAINILTNSVKYTEKGSVTLEISYTKTGNNSIDLTFHIKDTGIGIKEEDLPKLTQAFQRIEEKRNRSIEGTGLGMSIVSQLLALMGSKINVKSAYGEGSDFYFTITQKVIDWEPIGDFNETYRKSLESMSTYHETFHAPNARILVVDDTKLNLTVVKGLLKQTQVIIDTADSGEQALILAQKNKYDITFIDHRMPGMDGIETLHNMARTPNSPDAGVPSIALTANAISGAREMYLKEGFSDYLAKPIDSSKLESMLIKYLPKDKVQLYNGEDKAEESTDEPQPIANEMLRNIDGIDINAGIKNCGGEEILLDALKEFYEAADEKSRAISEFCANKDYANYTILVHALKSSARIIGANKLSELAAHLEKCGDERNEEEISAKTIELIELYKTCKDSLSSLFSIKDDSEKELISLESYHDALANIRECITAFDFDTADSIIELLDGYKIPGEEKELYQKIKQKILAVDREALLELLNIP